ncbi:oligopeptidase A [Ectothiorhodospiraceae bacterium 2226]|nr:oligopeptidase A [Ectothiorhodospiraceae bacterium 2226]
MDNPLLHTAGLPAFSQIRPEHVEPAIDQILADNRAAREALLAQAGPYTWDNLVAPLEALEDRLERAWSPVGHLNAVVNSEALRAAYNACLPKLSAYATELGHDSRLFAAYQSIREGREYQRLDAAQRKVIDNALRDFRLAGVDLPAQIKANYKAVQEELTALCSRFADNVLDATQAWTRHITDEAGLAGLPPSTRALARQAAERNGLEGWLLNLEPPTYIAVMTYADDRALREAMYEAYVTRASDQGPVPGRYDNTEVIDRILALRHQSAELLGFPNYAELSLATKMAGDPEHVLSFLNGLAERAVPRAREEFAALCAYAREHHGLAELGPWDVAYYSEKLRKQRHDLSQEELKPYFPAPRVVQGLFAVVERLYGLRVQALDGVDSWHEDVRFYEIRDAEDTVRGRFYLDLYARPHKRGGAWMDECVRRRRSAEGLQVPVAYLTCNFTPPVDDTPALLTHNEVVTLFHEFGHGLHHMLTRVDYAPVSGINGVPWDAVELPSQFMENWCWEYEALALISGHVESGEPLPRELFDKLRAARNFQSAMKTVRQLEFALFDFRLHHEYHPAWQGRYVQPLLDDVRDKLAVVPVPPYNRFQHSFSHIFAGGYAAGYYSYKWAEVLSADAYSQFEEHGIFDQATGRRFLETVLEQGGSREPMELFVAFRGREPRIDALLRHNGLAA